MITGNWKAVCVCVWVGRGDTFHLHPCHTVPQNPPHLVKLVMETVCIMKGLKPERKPDPSGSGKMIEDFWGPSMKLLGDMKFLESLKTYDKDNIPQPVMKKIREKSVCLREMISNSILQPFHLIISFI